VQGRLEEEEWGAERPKRGRTPEDATEWRRKGLPGERIDWKNNGGTEGK
jgi:hypothetical protein